MSHESPNTRIDTTADSRTSDDIAASDDDSDRRERYVGDMSGKLTDLKPFYNGQPLDNRIAAIRDASMYVRRHWQDSGTLQSKVRNILLDTGEIEFKDEFTKELADRLFTVHREWLESGDIDEKEKIVTFDAIKLYTSQEGYNAIYSLINSLTRSEDSVTPEDLVQSVYFLVELVYIDAYNYCVVRPEKSNFVGEVYRGMVLNESDIQSFRNLRSKPVSTRTIGVPLGLVSSSANINIAKKFIKQNMKHHASKQDSEPRKPLLNIIRVIGLKQDYIDYYTKTFAPSTLTTTYAVDIHELSRHRSEQEVLLCSPFLMVLDIYETEDCLGDGSPCEVIEAVMLNTNRHPIRESRLGERAGRAREVFACMINVCRGEYAVDYFVQKGLLTDADECSDYLTENRMKLQRLMSAE